MNPMDQLRAARPAHLDTPTGDRTRAAELSAAMSGPRAARRARPRPRPAWGFGVAGLTAAAAVAAVTVTVITTGGPAPAPRAPAVAMTPSDSPAPVPLTARQVLLVAAESSLKAAATSGAYWYVEGESGVAYQVGDSERYIVNGTGRTRKWIARSPKAESWWVSQNLGVRPAPGQEDAWKRDGSPTSWEVTLGGKKRIVMESKGGKPFGNAVNIGDKVFELAGRSVSVADLRKLPTSPAALKKHLLAGYAEHGPASDEAQDADSWLFQTAAGLLDEMPVEPAVRAAAYEVLAGLPGVRSLGEVADALGRTGQGIGRTETWPDGRYERQLIIDPGTGVLLTDRTVAVHATGDRAWAKPGTPVLWTATTTATWTDEPPQKP